MATKEIYKYPYNARIENKDDKFLSGKIVSITYKGGAIFVPLKIKLLLILRNLYYRQFLFLLYYPAHL